MTISSQTPFFKYTAIANQTQFTVPFVFEFGSDLAIYYIPPNVVPSEQNLLEYSIDYTVTGNGYESDTRYITLSSSTFPTGAAANAIVIVTVDMPFDRNTDFQGGSLSSYMLNDQLDRLTAEVQQLRMNQDYFGLKYELYDDLPGDRGANILPVLPAHTGSAIPIWSTDNEANLVATELEEASDLSTLRADLANNLENTDGAGLVGYFNTSTNVSETVRAALNYIMSHITGGALPVGTLVPSYAQNATMLDQGFLPLTTVGTIGNASSGATIRANADTFDLFLVLWGQITDDWCPVVGGRGASATADFDDNKQIYLPNALGRCVVNTGPAALTDNVFTATASSNTFTMAVSHPASSWFEFGQIVQVSTTGVLPNGLSPSTNYYVTPISATTFHLSTSSPNCVSSTYITVTNAGTGVHSIQLQDSNNVPGQYYGCDTSLQGIQHLASHGHFFTTPYVQINAGDGSNGVYKVVTPQSNQTSVTGGSQPMTNAPPFVVCPYFIKFK